MPQLDKVSYFTQFFWLTLTITVFYVTLVKYYLPPIARTLKMRQHKVEAQTNTNPYEVEGNQILQDRGSSVRDSLVHSRQALDRSFDSTIAWVSNTVQQTNETHFKKPDQSYYNHLGKELVSQEVNQTQLKQILPLSAYEKCGLMHYGQKSLTNYFLVKVLNHLLAKSVTKKVSKKKRS